VDDDHAGLVPAQLEARAVSGEEVEKEKTAQQRPTGNGDGKRLLTGKNIPPSQLRAKEFSLHLVNAQIDLRKGGNEDQHHRKS